ncbi:MAG: peptide chain release factor N(5)-glutamine methyltransferase [Hyphomicrobiaceae bacterium]|nr:peptide chain release factor N(5)-glutamine methyltransferase [Hyphomicrobiaceae bacterium]
MSRVGQPASASLVELHLGPTIDTAYRAMAKAFARAGLETPETDARFLLQGILQRSPTDIVLARDMPLSKEDIDRLEAAARRRLDHEPVSRILGERSFYGRDFIVTPDVLDPRPDTETVVDEVLKLAQASGVPQNQLRIVDVGVGSGAILLTLMAELPEARGVGTDISPRALAVAQRNAERLGMLDRIELVETDMLEGVTGPVHILVSNPPYIPAGDIAGLSRDVREHDPQEALDGGPDGLKFYRKLSNFISKMSGNIAVCVEVGAGQAAEVRSLLLGALQGAGTLESWFSKDLGGHIRCVTVERHS